MIIKYAIALAVVLIVAAFATWAFLPARHLPGNRARHLRLRLHLRLHPGKASPPPSPCGCGGAAWPPCAARARSAPPSRCTSGSVTRAPTRCFSAAPTTGTASRSRWKSTFW